MAECVLCHDTTKAHYTVIGDMAFCDKCYTKVKKLVRNYVNLKHVTKGSNVVAYTLAREQLEKSIRARE